MSAYGKTPWYKPSFSTIFILVVVMGYVFFQYFNLDIDALGVSLNWRKTQMFFVVPILAVLCTLVFFSGARDASVEKNQVIQALGSTGSALLGLVAVGLWILVLYMFFGANPENYSDSPDWLIAAHNWSMWDKGVFGLMARHKIVTGIFVAVCVFRAILRRVYALH